jgi:hypothetical protein
MNQIAREIDYIAKMQNIILTKRRLFRLKNVANEPFNTPPEGNAPLNEVGSVAGAGTAGTSPIILAFRVPDGWDGLIQWIKVQYTGSNFVNNSGQLEWALSIEGLFIKGYHALRSQFQGTENGLKISPGAIIKGGQRINIICSVDPNFIPQGGSQIIAGVSGFYYPNGVARTN